VGNIARVGAWAAPGRKGKGRRPAALSALDIAPQLPTYQI